MLIDGSFVKLEILDDFKDMFDQWRLEVTFIIYSQILLSNLLIV